MRTSNHRFVRTPLLLPSSLLTFIVIVAPLAVCQDVDAPSFGMFAGAGVEQGRSSRAALQAGESMEQIFPNHWVGYMFEGAYLGPFGDLHGGSAVFAFNYVTSWQRRSVPKLLPFATLGYAQLFGTGNAVDFGAGVDLRLRPSFGIRVEGRDYLSFAPHQHNIAIRIGIRRYVWD